MTTNGLDYSEVKKFLEENPGCGKTRLAQRFGCKTPSARRMIERWRGEKEGHSHDPQYLEVKACKDQHPNWGAKRILCVLRHLTLDRVKLHLARYCGATGGVPAPPKPAQPGPPPAPAQAGGELRDSTGKDSRDLCYLGTNIRSVEDLLVYATVDDRIWEIDRFVINRWEVGARGPAGVVTSPLFQIKVWLRRREAEVRIKDVLSSMLLKFKEAAPQRPRKPRKASAKGLLEISVLDLHLGKACWAPEVGESYNLDIARRQFNEAVDDLMAKASAFDPARILLPVGNDFFNVDTASQTTAKGTPQTEVGRWQESFVLGRQLIAQAVDRLLEVAPVHVVMVSGNHDLTRVFYLGDALSCWFSRTEDVVVDNAPTLRKYVQWGRNLIGFTHGSEEPHINLPLVMATEQPEAWASSKFREWHVGHWHSRKRKFFLPLEDQNGITIRVIPSLSASDAWHKSKGYQGMRAAEAFYWDQDCGCIAEFVHAAA